MKYCREIHGVRSLAKSLQPAVNSREFGSRVPIKRRNFCVDDLAIVNLQAAFARSVQIGKAHSLHCC